MSCSFGVPKGLIATGATGFTSAAAGPSKRAITKQALRITRGAADGNDHSFFFDIQNPSNRLRCTIEISVESDSGAELTIANLTWYLQAMSVNPQSGRVTPLQMIYGTAAAPKPAPDGYELDSGVRRMRGKVNVPSTTTFGFAVGDAANIVVNAVWEADEEIQPDELEALMSLASLNINGSPAATTFL